MGVGILDLQIGKDLMSFQLEIPGYKKYYTQTPRNRRY